MSRSTLIIFVLHYLKNLNHFSSTDQNIMNFKATYTNQELNMFENLGHMRQHFNTIIIYNVCT